MAERIVVTKKDAAPASAGAALEARLATLAPHALVCEAVRGEIAADAVFVDLLRPAALEALARAGHDHVHDDACGHDHLAESDIASDCHSAGGAADLAALPHGSGGCGGRSASVRCA